MTTTDWVFLTISALTILAAYRVVTSQKIMHAALWLGATFFGVGGIFLLLGADFLAAAQVLIYVGAVTTIIIFGIMLSSVEDIRGQSIGSMWQRLSRQFSSPRHGILAVAAAGGLALALLILFNRSVWPAAPELQDTNTAKALGYALFGEYVVPLEIASLVLLVALIGAIVLATREEEKQQ